jgi:hypothetical protein
LESAIEWGEDRIQAAHTQWPQGAKLCTNESDLYILAQLAGVSAQEPRVLHIDAVA